MYIPSLPWKVQTDPHKWEAHPSLMIWLCYFRSVVILNTAAMIQVREVAVLNASYLACCIFMDRWILSRIPRNLYPRPGQLATDFFYIVWCCVYVTILCCVLRKFIYGELANMAYLCSWFLLLQTAFYTTALLSVVFSFSSLTGRLTVIAFPALQSIAWVIFVECMSTGSSVVREFHDLGYFTVHVLPVLSGLLHEVCNGADVASLRCKSGKFRVWAMYSPVMVLTLYVLLVDPSDVYERSTRPIFTAITCFVANVRIFLFPLSWFGKTCAWSAWARSCSRDEILSRLSPSYTAMATDADQRKWTVSFVLVWRHFRRPNLFILKFVLHILLRFHIKICTWM